MIEVFKYDSQPLETKSFAFFYDFLETTSTSEDETSAEQYYGELTRLKKKLGNLSTFEESINIIDNKFLIFYF